MNILIVDDDPQIAYLMGKLLMRDGWQVTTAHSLHDARTKPGPYDVVVADVRLENGDGRELRADYATTPFVVISGAADEVPDLYKPFTAEQLRTALSLALDRAR